MGNLGPKIVTIGGGTGTFTVLTALVPHVRPSAIVSMADNGGSSGRLRDERGVLPPGDVRQALVALAEESDLMRQLLNHRSADGHNFGNLLLATLAEITGSMPEAINEVGRLLNVKGKVLPVSVDDTNLVLRLSDGTIIHGEDAIGENCAGQGYFTKGKRPDLYLEPAAKLNSDAAQAIASADMVVVCPGKLYSSIAPNLMVDGMVDALVQTNARVVYVCNLMTQLGQTEDFCVADFADSLEAIAGRPFIDDVLYNTAVPSPDLLERYATEGEEVIGIELETLLKRHYRATGAELLSPDVNEQHPNDALKRTLIRHDTDALGKALMRLYYS